MYANCTMEFRRVQQALTILLTSDQKCNVTISKIIIVKYLVGTDILGSEYSKRPLKRVPSGQLSTRFDLFSSGSATKLTMSVP